MALAGSVLQLIALVGLDFYVAQGERKDAWFGIPHASDLILLSALAAIVMFAVTALGRNPVRGRSVGLIVGVVGLLATLQLGYRMVVPPFEGDVPSNPGIIGSGCLYYCSPSEAAPADLLIGIWIAFLGCLAVTLGGFLHARSRTARETAARPWVALTQSGASPWLGGSLGSTGPVCVRFHILHLLHDHGRRRRGGLERLATDAPHQQPGPVNYPDGHRSGVGRGPRPSPAESDGPGRASSRGLGLISASRIVEPPFGSGPVEI
ncbi:MAG: hypothetical protein M3R38_20855 [Actinomycetota bacterium]|nr:hypothetical protein [Actinomycetota bacterium]